MDQLEREEKIKVGLRAVEILENEAIMTFFKDELERIKVCMFNTRPDETKERNQLYYQHFGLSEFLESLKAYKHAAIEEIEALESETRAETKEESTDDDCYPDGRN